MAFLYLPYVLIMLLAAAVAGWVSAYVWRRRTVPGGIYFAGLMAAVAFWALLNAIEYSLVHIPTRILCSKISYPAVVSVPPLWFLFVLAYTQREAWLTPRRRVLVWIIPVVTLVLAWTNELHWLYWPTITPVSDEPGAMLTYTHGVLFLPNLIYAYGMMVAGTWGLLRIALGSATLYRSQAAALIAGAIIPWIGNAVYLAGWTASIDTTPIGFALSGLLMVWGIFRFQMFDLVPVARDAVVENMTDGVLVLDTHDRIVDINPAAAQWLGREPGQVIGRPLDQVPSPWSELGTRYQNIWQEQTEITLPGDEGESQTLDLRISPLHDRQQHLSGRLMVLRDITARRQAEEALRHYTQELETSNAELDAFAHTVAHDLKNPLSVLIGFSTLLETRMQRMEPAQVTDNLHRITATGYKMWDIIQELLLLASVRQMAEVEVGPLDMGALASEALGRFANRLAEPNVIIVTASDWPTTVGHAPWVEEVWVNYISNALKYGGDPEKGIPPRVELGFDAPPNDSSVRFWVKDNGTGLTPEQQAQLFTPFTRLYTTEAEGHGLGLSIVQRIVTRLGGKVGVESAPGMGSSFWFTLPVP
ncbi:MAG: histidine kinase N-terminal 7TM domain-containing protein [Anaerolineae bacterium]|jgi:PAS domain S-box-containing protein|nr:histidine kinase N-terminal 7TM domain-containing protein [Anaerolineae bacterium]